MDSEIRPAETDPQSGAHISEIGVEKSMAISWASECLGSAVTSHRTPNDACLRKGCESFGNSLYDGPPSPSNPEHF